MTLNTDTRSIQCKFYWVKFNSIYILRYQGINKLFSISKLTLLIQGESYNFYTIVFLRLYNYTFVWFRLFTPLSANRRRSFIISLSLPWSSDLSRIHLIQFIRLLQLCTTDNCVFFARPLNVATNSYNKNYVSVEPATDEVYYWRRARSVSITGARLRRRRTANTLRTDSITRIYVYCAISHENCTETSD